MNRNIMVIGAGISGLSAAYELQKHGFSPTVLEKEPFVGGRMRSERIEGGFLVDTGAQDLHDRKASKHTFDLMEQIGLEDQVIEFDFNTALLREGVIHKMPRNKFMGAFGFGGLSLSSQAKLVKMVQQLASWHRKLDREKPEKWMPLDSEDVENHILTEFNEELLHYFVDPLIRPLAMGPMKGLSLIYLYFILKLEFFSRHSTLKNGIGSFPEKLARECDVRLDHVVEKVTLARGKVREVRLRHNGRSTNLPVDAVICAVPAPAIPEMIPELRERSLAYIRKVRFASSPVVVFGLENRVLKDLVGVAIPEKEGLKSAVLFEVTNKYEGLAPPGHGLMVAWAATDVAVEWSRWDEEKIIRLFRNEVSSFLPTFNEKVLFCKCYKREYAIPRYWPNQVLASQDFLKSTEGSGLFFAGDYLSPAMGIEGAIITGRRAAEGVVDYLAGVE